MVVLALFLAPVPVILVLDAYGHHEKLNTYPWICFFLWLLLGFPGLIFALCIIFKYSGKRYHPGVM